MNNWVTEHYAFYDSFSSPTNASSFVTRKPENVTNTPMSYVTRSLPAVTSSDAANLSKFVTEMSSFDHFVA